MNITQALGEIRKLEREFKALSKLDEVLEVASQLEQTAVGLKQSIDALKSEKADLEIFVEKTNKYLEELVARTKEKTLEADVILSDAKEKARLMREKASQDAKDAAEQVQGTLAAQIQQIVDNRMMIDNLTDEVSKLKNKRVEFIQNFESEKKRLAESFK